MLGLEIEVPAGEVSILTELLSAATTKESEHYQGPE
jgi:hypothetical protein